MVFILAVGSEEVCENYFFATGFRVDIYGYLARRISTVIVSGISLERFLHTLCGAQFRNLADNLSVNPEFFLTRTFSNLLVSYSPRPSMYMRR